MRLTTLIKCPYCFKSFRDDEVHFRSSYVFSDEEKEEYLPVGVEDDESFLRFWKSDPKKEEYLEKRFYERGVSEAYDRFWKIYGGVYTEPDYMGERLYERKIINPNNPDHQKHLKEISPNNYFIREGDMVTGIQLKDMDESISKMRVCPFCNNPLPKSYGLYRTFFIPVLGIGGSGKTVFLSQLFKGLNKYLSVCGMISATKSQSLINYVIKNHVKEDTSMPNPVRDGIFEQPVIFNVSKKKSDSLETITIVMYDIPGGILSSETVYELGIKYAGLIRESDGIICVMDSYRFFNSNDEDYYEQARLDPIHYINSVFSETTKKNGIPLAICFSKMDMIANSLPENLKNYIKSDYVGISEIISNIKVNKCFYDIREHKEIERNLYEFVESKDSIFCNGINMLFSNYSLFGFTALDCEVINNDVPVGPICPHRIEEPFYWLLSKFGFIETNEIKCPNCGNTDCKKISPEQIVEKKSIFQKNIYEVNRICNLCNHKFYVDENGNVCNKII